VLAQEADRKNKTIEFTRQMKEQQLAVGSQLTQTLRAELMKQGYTVTLVPSDRRASAPENGIPDYSHMSADTDAVLDVRLGLVGYVAPADSPNYVPFIRADAQLLSTKSKSQVYFKALSFGVYIDHQSENIELIAPASKEYAYGDFPELMKNAKAAQKGLDSGVGVIAARIVQDLTGAPAPGPFDPKACELERDYARRAAATQGEASAQLKRLSERKAAQCKAQQGAAPGH
jgi:hypothetical protein